MPGSPLSYEPSYRSIRIIKRDYKPRLLPSPFCEAKNFPSDRIFRRQEWKDRLSVQIERKLEIFLYIIRGEIRWNLIERGTKKEIGYRKENLLWLDIRRNDHLSITLNYSSIFDKSWTNKPCVTRRENEIFHLATEHRGDVTPLLEI